MPTRDLNPADLPTAAHLLAARHRADRAREPALDPRFETETACRELLELSLDDRSSGAVLFDDDEPVGFLLGRRMSPARDSLGAYFFAPGSVAVPIHGHAVAAGRDAREVYRSLYAHAARSWAEDGFCDHHVSTSAGDEDAMGAWVGLGFGRAFATALREVAVPAPGASSSIEIRRVGVDDAEEVERLSHELRAYQSASPMFYPDPREIDRAWRRVHAQDLADDGCAFFLGYRDGEAVAMQTYVSPRSLAPLEIPAEPTVYLFEGIASERARGGGFGSALLERGLGWAAQSGFRYCALHYLCGNPTGEPFWLGHGFRPIGFGLQRRLDPRAAVGPDS